VTTGIERRGLLASLAGRLPAASHDELRVIDRVLGRLELGRDRYGLLDLAKPRDWRRERFEERLDALVYDACEELALEDRARAELREAARVEMIGGPNNLCGGGIDVRVRFAANFVTPVAYASHPSELAEWLPDAHHTAVSDVPARIASRDIDDEPYAEWDVTDVGGEGG
jgi:hypothetical protein